MNLQLKIILSSFIQLFDEILNKIDYKNNNIIHPLYKYLYKDDWLFSNNKLKLISKLFNQKYNNISTDILYQIIPQIIIDIYHSKYAFNKKYVFDIKNKQLNLVNTRCYIEYYYLKEYKSYYFSNLKEIDKFKSQEFYELCYNIINNFLFFLNNKMIPKNYYFYIELNSDFYDNLDNKIINKNNQNTIILKKVNWKTFLIFKYYNKKYWEIYNIVYLHVIYLLYILEISWVIIKEYNKRWQTDSRINFNPIVKWINIEKEYIKDRINNLFSWYIICKYSIFNQLWLEIFNEKTQKNIYPSIHLFLANENDPNYVKYIRYWIAIETLLWSPNTKIKTNLLINYKNIRCDYINKSNYIKLEDTLIIEHFWKIRNNIFHNWELSIHNKELKEVKKFAINLFYVILELNKIENDKLKF